MSAKVVYNLQDEKQELHKQLGCMNGIFQLFDRRYLLGQRGSSHSQKGLPSGQSNDGGITLHNETEKQMAKKPVKEKQRSSFESSRNSFSSSCSSTFSSVDCSKRAPTEPSSFSQSMVSEPTSPILPMKQPNSFSQPADFRDIVKDSMSREPRVLALKTMPKEESKGTAMKYIDSPRPFFQQSPVQPKVNSYDRVDRNLAKLREVSRRFKEEKDGSLPLAPKDRPRFSYDGRESRYTSKSTVKLKELPRLSLDSRQSSIRSSSSESRHFLQETSSQISNHEPGSNKRPSSGVVARLMGLEALPNSISADEGEAMKMKPRLDDDLIPLSRSSRTDKEIRHEHVFGSPRTHKELTLPKIKSISSPRIPLEPAPWKQESGGSQKPSFKYKEDSTRAERSTLSVYGEIEKRLTELEFKRSGKDLRALKQILEAMQHTRRKLENSELPSIESQTSRCTGDYDNFDQQQPQKSNQSVSPTIKGTSLPKRGGFPSTATKPAKLIGQPGTGDSMMITGLQRLKKENYPDEKRDLVGRRKAKNSTRIYKHLGGPTSGPLPSVEKKMNARIQKSSIPSKVPEYMTVEKSTSSGSSGVVSPRLQRTKSSKDRQSSGSTQTSELSRIRRPSNMQQAETNLKTRKLKPKSTTNNQSSGFCIETVNYGQGYAVSLQSESNSSSLASQNETEVTSTDRTGDINSVYQPKDHKFRNYTARLSEDRPMAELATLTLEQPSPVSVLDAVFYPEDSPSPVKKISYAFKDDDESLQFNEADWNQIGQIHLEHSTCTDQSEFNQVNLENIKHLVRRIELLNCTHQEPTVNRTTSLCQNTHPDHQYITEILLASGFLDDPDFAPASTQLHSSAHHIKPELFSVLEKTKGRTELTSEEHNQKNAYSKFNDKLKRKLLFDTVSDILSRKLAMTDSFELCTSGKPKGRIASGEKLLKEVWLEIDHLQENANRGLADEEDEVISIINADVKRSEDWTEYSFEVPGLVLDIERLVFKDLISEVVGGAVVGLQDWTARHCRQLFPK